MRGDSTYIKNEYYFKEELRGQTERLSPNPEVASSKPAVAKILSSIWDLTTLEIVLSDRIMGLLVLDSINNK